MKISKTIVGFWATIIALLASIVFFVYPLTIGKIKPNLSFKTLSISQIFASNGNLSELSIKYRNIELQDSNQNISMVIVRVINKGAAAILLSYFDDQINYGIIIKEGKLINRPELLYSSDTSYYINVIKYYDENAITFNKFIFNQSQYFDIKLLIMHDANKSPYYLSFGTIANQDGGIEITSFINRHGQVLDSWFNFLFLFLAFIIGFILSVLLHFYIFRVGGAEYKYHSLLKEILLTLKQLHHYKN